MSALKDYLRLYALSQSALEDLRIFICYDSNLPGILTAEERSKMVDILMETKENLKQMTPQVSKGS